MPSVIWALAHQALRQPRATAALVARRFRQDPAWTALQAMTALPRPARTTLAACAVRIGAPLQRRWPSAAAPTVVTAFGLLHTGDHGRLRGLLTSRLAVAGTRERIALARLLTEHGLPTCALDLLHGAVTTTPAGLEARGRARAAAGWLRGARADLDRAAAGGRPTAAVERRRVDGLLRATSPQWHPVAPTVASAPPIAGRVLHLLNNSLPHVVAGYTVRTHRVAQAQRAAGLDPVLATRAGFPWLQGAFDAATCDVVDGIAYHHTRADPAVHRDPAALLVTTTARTAALLARHRPAALQPTSPFDNARAALALRAASGLPVVYEVRGFLEDSWCSRLPPGAERSDRYRRTREIEGWCMRQADRVVTLGAAMRDDIVARGVDPSHVIVIGNAVDPDAFQPRPPDPGLRAALGVDHDEVVLGYVSSLVAYEGVDHLLAAIAQLRARGRRVRGLVVGDGEARAALEHRAGQLGLATAVRFVGRVPPDDVQRWYAQIDVFVVPRVDARVTRTVTPLKPLEAMALARPVVVSDLPALRELVQPGVTGLAFTPEDPRSLADTVEPLLDDPAARAALGGAAREWVADERTWRANGERYRRLYADLGVTAGVSSGRRPDRDRR